jgi:hypothetical protein
MNFQDMWLILERARLTNAVLILSEFSKFGELLKLVKSSRREQRISPENVTDPSRATQVGSGVRSYLYYVHAISYLFIVIP